ncbi:MAG: SCO family protein [Planctomycetota bacterium]|nr:SCO family protein [Planctomycetota bacterium]
MTLSPPGLVLSFALVALAGIASGCDRGLAGESGPTGPEPTIGRRTVVWQGRPLSTPLPRPAFELRDTAGQPYDFAARTSGRLTLLFFGYTSCPDVCSMHMNHIAAALRGLEIELPGAREAIDVVFVAIDPARDTPDQLRSWLDHFDPGFVGLTGDEAELQAAQRAAAVPTAVRDPGSEDESYTMSHASYVLLYTQDDLAHLRYPFDTGTGDWLQDLRRLVRDGWRAS